MASAKYSIWPPSSGGWRSFKDWVRKNPPVGGPLRAQDRLKAVIRVALIVARKFRADEIPLRASALTFTVILSLVPFLALGTAVLKEFGVGHNFRQIAHRFVDQLDRPVSGTTSGADQDKASAAEGSESSAAAQPSLGAENSPPSISMHLRRAIDRIFDYVERTNFAAIGAAGVVGFVISALVLFGSLETALNAVWQVDSSRSLVRKILDYLALVLLLPPALNAALAAEAAIRSPVLYNHLPAMLHLSWLGPLFFKVFPVGLMIVSFVLLYGFLPNTRVRFRSALVGGLVAGGSWFVIQIVYLRLQIGVARYNAIYGSFATLPLFLLWLYFGWLTFLVGSTISFASQHWRTCFWEGRPLKPLARLALAIEVIELVRAEWSKGRASTMQTLAGGLQLPEAQLAPVLTDLCESDILRKAGKSENGYCPVAESPVDDRSEIVTAILGVAEGERDSATLVNRAGSAAKQALRR